MSDKKDSKITIDLSAQPFSGDWSDIRDCFLLKATPIWFTWLSWIALLTAINFTQRKTGSILLTVIFYHSLAMLGLYYDAALRRVKFVGLPIFLTRKKVRVLVVAVAALLVYAAAILSGYIVTLLTVKT